MRDNMPELVPHHTCQLIFRLDRCNQLARYVHPSAHHRKGVSLWRIGNKKPEIQPAGRQMLHETVADASSSAPNSLSSIGRIPVAPRSARKSPSHISCSGVNILAPGLEGLSAVKAQGELCCCAEARGVGESSKRRASRACRRRVIGRDPHEEIYGPSVSDCRVASTRPVVAIS